MISDEQASILRSSTLLSPKSIAEQSVETNHRKS
jgi:hypothetical protein